MRNWQKNRKSTGSRADAKTQRGGEATKMKTRNLNREIYERREKRKDEEVSRGDAEARREKRNKKNFPENDEFFCIALLSGRTTDRGGQRLLGQDRLADISSVPLGREIILSRIPDNQLPGYYRRVLPGRRGLRLSPIF